MTGSVHDSLLPRFDFGSIFAYLMQGAHAVKLCSELLYGKIRIQSSLKCAFLTDEQRRLQFMVKMLSFNHLLRIFK